tara:strand:- start:1536 stop:2024 length:489 start_codon:yes stop_codon:yes gene_type:complete
MKKINKLQKIKRLLKKHPKKNNKEIGAMAKANPNYVAKIRRIEKQHYFHSVFNNDDTQISINEARVIMGKPRPKNRVWFLNEAELLINGPRANDYGESQINHERIATMWSIICKTEITPEQVIACMIALKLSRLSEDITKSDSWLDIIGYAALGGEMTNVKS